MLDPPAGPEPGQMTAVPDDHHNVGVQRVEQAEGVSEPRVEADDEESPPIALGRVIWAATALVFLVAALILLIGRRYGYAEVTFAVAVAAGINLL
jgi:hypothetical protein